LPTEIYGIIFPFFSTRNDFLSIFLVCHQWNEFGFRYLDLSCDENIAIRWASKNGNIKIVDRLLQNQKVDPSHKSHQAIRYSAQNGHLQVVERLLQDPRVDPSVMNQQVIQSAAKKWTSSSC